MTRRVRPLVILIVIVATIGCDRVTKRIATATLAGTTGRSYVADTVRLAYAENTGGFLSLGASWPAEIRTVVFTVGTGVALLLMTAFAVRSGLAGWPALGFLLFLAGTASNWIDRVMRGSVVDFLNIGIGPVRTGVFNVADVAIMAGAAIYLVAEVRTWRTLK